MCFVSLLKVIPQLKWYQVPIGFEPHVISCRQPCLAVNTSLFTIGLQAACQTVSSSVIDKMIGYFRENSMQWSVGNYSPNNHNRPVISVKVCGLNWCQINGILPKGPYPPCLRMADRALLAGYPRNANIYLRCNFLAIYRPVCLWTHCIGIASLIIHKQNNGEKMCET